MTENYVKAGAALLDKVNPGWETRVSISTLAMWDCSHCILGQLYGQYYQGVQKLSHNRRSEYAERQEMAELGFNIPDYDDDAEPQSTRDMYGALAVLWRKEILDRRLKRMMRKVEERELVPA